jgi:Protein of unknown function (DUF4058)
MPLLDHFHPPLQLQYPFESFHSSWATRLADALNENWLSEEFLAAEHTHAGTHLEIDIATFEKTTERNGTSAGDTATATVPRVWTPPVAPRTMPAVFPDSFEVRVFTTMSGLTLVGAIELISPSNKDRPEERQAFVTKCASYLQQGISLVIIDIVTNRRANLHNETMRLMGAGEQWELPPEFSLYAVAYRPVLRGEKAEIDVWTEPCAVGSPLPTMPLRLTGDLFVPVEFEATYQETCRKRRIG